MTMRFEFPRPTQPAIEGGSAPLSREWLRYLEALARKVDSLERRMSVVDDGLVISSITAGELAANFTAGVGKTGTKWEGWEVYSGVEAALFGRTTLVYVGG